MTPLTISGMYAGLSSDPGSIAPGFSTESRSSHPESVPAAAAAMASAARRVRILLKGLIALVSVRS